MKQIIMKACSLVVLCLVNISLACQPKIDTNNNLIPYENDEQYRIETSIPEVNFLGGNGQAHDLLITETLANTAEDNSPSETGWDGEGHSITNYPHSGYASGSGNVGKPSIFHGDVILPEGKIHFHPHNHGSNSYSIHNLPSSGYNVGIVDNEKLPIYQKGKAYTPESNYVKESVVGGGLTGHSHSNIPGSGYNFGAGDNLKLSSYQNDKSYPSGGYYASEKDIGKGLTTHHYHNLPNSGYNIDTGDHGRLPTYNKGNTYTSHGYYARESGVGQGKNAREAWDFLRIGKNNSPDADDEVILGDIGELAHVSRGKYLREKERHHKSSDDGKAESSWKIRLNNRPRKLPNFYKKNAVDADSDSHSITGTAGNIKNILGAIWKRPNLSSHNSANYNIGTADNDRLARLFEENSISQDDNLYGEDVDIVSNYPNAGHVVNKGLNNYEGIGRKADIYEPVDLDDLLSTLCQSHHDGYNNQKSKDALRQIYSFGLG